MSLFEIGNKILTVFTMTSILIFHLKAESKKIDPETNLVMDKGFYAVVENCLTCHPSNLITEKHRSKEDWLKVIKWMQTDFGLWELDKDTKKSILDYLGKNYSKVKKKEGLVPNLNLNNIK
ncbi:MAG: hypothetical protein GXO31_01540 [Epsilonproteobacteria bacterium]|nr:hypothetical protein [Campylobacterota bacterium]